MNQTARKDCSFRSAVNRGRKRLACVKPLMENGLGAISRAWDGKFIALYYTLDTFPAPVST
jgi:hypothetical protein